MGLGFGGGGGKGYLAGWQVSAACAALASWQVGAAPRAIGRVGLALWVRLGVQPVGRQAWREG